ncbi:MAG: 3-deoxy-manno-octulosonate cytidylyltransferase [Rhodoferax sp.]|nr:3-deoxy-manno-octulosonate cytidylyltransferase [Rhodoferax sp.]
MRFTVLIPARLASTRLPNKPLADIGGLPMIVRVAQRVMSGTDSRVVVAADSAEIITACQAHGIEAVLTRTDHPSGSDRLAEACNILGLRDDEIVVNVQGDEPLIDPALVSDVASLLLHHPQMSMSTAAHPIGTLDDFSNPNIVKVVLDANNVALYFSRAPIAFARDFPGQAWWQDDAQSSPGMAGAAPLRHVGIYGYRAGFLRLFPTLPRAPIEIVEALEQLRAMWHGHRIAVHVTHRAPGPGVDTPEDLERVRILFKA